MGERGCLGRLEIWYPLSKQVSKGPRGRYSGICSGETGAHPNSWLSTQALHWPSRRLIGEANGWLARQWSVGRANGIVRWPDKWRVLQAQAPAPSAPMEFYHHLPLFCVVVCAGGGVSKERALRTRDPRSGRAYVVDGGDNAWRSRAPGPHAHGNTAWQVVDGLRTGVLGQQKQSNDPRNNPSTTPAHQPMGSAKAETTPEGAPATAADRKQRPYVTNSVSQDNVTAVSCEAQEQILVADLYGVVGKKGV